MTLEQLRIFVAVAERQHVTEAARALNLAQSAANHAIASLEMQLPITRAILKCRKPSDNHLLLRLAPSWALLQMNLRLSHDFLLVSIRPDVCVITNLSLLFQITLKSNVE
jgi:hypothetical protein